MAFTAIIPGELVGQEGEVRIQYPEFRQEIIFLKTDNIIPVGCLSHRSFINIPLKIETLTLRVVEVINKDANEIPTVARYSHAARNAS